jgi:hypothetical protein
MKPAPSADRATVDAVLRALEPLIEAVVAEAVAVIEAAAGEVVEELLEAGAAPPRPGHRSALARRHEN